jgi:acetylornithine/N-succinyldiaminopimelate aminotransferase
MFEPIQGEGGIHVASQEYMKEVRRICDEKQILLLLDEVQTGMGRTGAMFAYQHYGIVPDAMMLAKSLGGGVPIGACVVHEKLAHCLNPGTHASTFGGNPLVCAAALAVFKTIEKKSLLTHTRSMGECLCAQLEDMKKKYGFIKEIRGMGLMIGVQCTKECARIVERAMQKGLLINGTQGNVLRIMPPITVTKRLINTAMRILDQAIRETI